MAGDIGLNEQVILLPAGQDVAAAASLTPYTEGKVSHYYGTRVIIADVPPSAEATVRSAIVGTSLVGDAVALSKPEKAQLSPVERLGLEALELRQSAGYLATKANRRHADADWDSGVADQPGCTDFAGAAGAAAALAGAPTSARLTGSIAVGIIIVEGPTAALKFSEAERIKVVAEVQNGLGWLGSQSPSGVTWVYDIQFVSLTVKPGPDTLNADQKEALWRDPAMAKLGFAAGMGGVTSYVEGLRTKFNTTWAYCGFFTKYPIYHFAYASIGGPRLVMDYNNDGWGPDNIDRVFAHESGHIFGAPDEYAASGCNCGGSWGFYGKPNVNCANCAAGGGVDCLMKQNSWAMCAWTPYHLGFPLVEQTYSGVWRQGTDPYYLWVNASWQSFVAKWQSLAQQNLRLTDLKITNVDGADRYHGAWRQGTGGYYLWANATWDSFRAKWEELAKVNLRLVDLEVVQRGGQLLYSGVWLPGNDGYYLWVNASWQSFVAKWQELAQQNLRLIDIKIVNVGGTDRFYGVWRQGTGGYYLWANATWDSFRAKWEELAKVNLRLVDFEITQSGGAQRFSGVWLPGTDSYYLWVNVSWQNFKAKWEELAAQNLRLIDIEVVPPGGAQSPLPNITGLGLPASSNGAEDGLGGGNLSAAAATVNATEDGLGGGYLGAGAPTLGATADGMGGGVLDASTTLSGAAEDGMGGGEVGVSSSHAPSDGEGGGQLA